MEATNATGKSPPPTPSTKKTSTAKLIAQLEGEQLPAVEAGLAGVREAMQAGDERAVQAILVEQALVLQALGVRLLRYAGTHTDQPAAPTFVGLALKALDLSRKALLGATPQPTVQTALQVNVSRKSEAPDEERLNVESNELLEGDGQRLVT
jgi:hypothetical protein